MPWINETIDEIGDNVKFLDYMIMQKTLWDPSFFLSSLVDLFA